VVILPNLSYQKEQANAQRSLLRNLFNGPSLTIAITNAVFAARGHGHCVEPDFKVRWDCCWMMSQQRVIRLVEKFGYVGGENGVYFAEDGGTPTFGVILNMWAMEV
jgi:hypothetical protein